MTAATTTMPTVRANAAGARVSRDRARTAGQRVKAFVGRAFAGPAGFDDEDAWRFYAYLPMY
jgi:hypothetical protein